MGHNAMTGWFYRESPPPNDDAIFENLTRVIFQGGLSWELIQKRWTNFQQAFNNFSIIEVAKFTEDDFIRLIEDAGIIRNSKKIEATIYNAQEFVKIQEEYGTFSKYFATLDKANNYEQARKELSKRFKRLGTKSSYIFLYSIGENIKHYDEE